MKTRRLHAFCLLGGLMAFLSCSKETVQPTAMPMAAFSIQNNNCTAPCAVTFTNSSTNYTSSVWSFGDNTSSNQPNPVKTYANGGNYTVSLAVTGLGGTTNTSQVVTIGAPVPVIVKQWDKTIGGDGSDRLKSLLPTADGGYLLAGDSDSKAGGDKSQNAKGGTDYWVVKVDAGGFKQWDKSYGGSKGSRLSSVIVTADGGFLLAGSSQGDAGNDKSENSRGGNDYWVVKINASGVKQWDKTLGSRFDIMNAAIATPDGGYLLAGHSLSDAGGDKSETQRGNFKDYWVIKINASGAKQWDKTLGGVNDDIPTSIAVMPDGGYLIGGYSDSIKSYDKSEDSKGYNDFWLVKIR